LGGRDLIVGKASSNNRWKYEQMTRVALMHVTALDDLPTLKSSDGNGQ
jgi:hypothetical protein